MIYEKMTRLFSSGMPKQVRSNNASLDSFLAKVDEHLLGVDSVRITTLMEIKGHVLDKKAYYQESGCSEEEALERALESMESPAELALHQKAALQKKFIIMALQSGMMMSLCAFIFGSFIQDLNQQGLAIKCIFALGSGIFYGLLFSWVVIFTEPERAVPTSAETTGSLESETEFTVRHSYRNKWERLYLFIIFILMYSYGVYVFLMGLLAAINFAVYNQSSVPWGLNILTFPWELNLLLGVVMWNVAHASMRITFRKMYINMEGIQIQEVLAKGKRFSWGNIKRVGFLKDIRPWVRFFWRKVKYVEFTNANSKTERIFIYPTMLNADRLFLLCEKKLQEQTCEEMGSD